MTPSKLDLARTVGQRPRRRGASSIAGSVASTVLIRPAEAAAAGQLAEQHADHPQRPDQHQHVEVRLDDVADREVACEHLVAAVPEDADEAERREQVDERQEVRAQPRLVDRTVVDVVGFDGEALLLQAFRAEALHDAHAGDALFDDAREVGELLLQRQARPGYMRRVKRVAAMLRNGNAASANNASPGLCNTSTMTTATIVSTLAIVNGINNTTCWICWMSVFAFAINWPVCAWSWNAKCRLLQVRDESHAQIRSRRGTRDGTRRTGASRCRLPGSTPTARMIARPFERDIEVSRNDAFVDRLTGQRRGSRRVPRSTPDPARIPSQTHMCSGRTAARMRRHPARRIARSSSKTPPEVQLTRLPAPK